MEGTVTINQSLSGFILLMSFQFRQEETRILSDWKLKNKDKFSHRIFTK